MEELLKSAEPAIISASERLIELVDLVLNRSYGTPRKSGYVHFSGSNPAIMC